MFKTQIEELTNQCERACDEVDELERALKSKKEEVRDIKQAVTSLERLQAKYEPTEVSDEASSVSI